MKKFVRQHPQHSIVRISKRSKGNNVFIFVNNKLTTKQNWINTLKVMYKCGSLKAPKMFSDS